MASVRCKCGELLCNNEIPNDIELVVYTDKEWDQICTPDTIEPWKIPLPKYDVWRCPKCQRIYCFSGGYKKADKIYMLEEDNTLSEAEGGNSTD